MTVKLRLMRMGKKKQPTYRIVASDSRSPRDGRFIEIVGTYAPRSEPSVVEVDNARAVRWLAQGAQPTDTVRKLLAISGAWTEFEAQKGRPHAAAITVTAPAPKPAAKPAAKAAAEPAAVEEATKELAETMEDAVELVNEDIGDAVNDGVLTAADAAVKALDHAGQEAAKVADAHSGAGDGED